MNAWIEPARVCWERLFQGEGRPATRNSKRTRLRPRWDRLERRETLSVAAPTPIPAQSAEVRGLGAIHEAARRGPRLPNYSITQLRQMLPGKWRVFYDASSVFGPGAQGAQEITFTGPRGAPQFISTTGVVVRGLVGPAYYQFSSWGTYTFLSNKLVRLTITGGSPTEYLNNGIIIPGGQNFPVQFLNRNQIIVQGQTYNRVPLNSTIFNP